MFNTIVLDSICKSEPSDPLRDRNTESGRASNVQSYKTEPKATVLWIILLYMPKIYCFSALTYRGKIKTMMTSLFFYAKKKKTCCIITTLPDVDMILLRKYSHSGPWWCDQELPKATWRLLCLSLIQGLLLFILFSLFWASLTISSCSLQYYLHRHSCRPPQNTPTPRHV